MFVWERELIIEFENKDLTTDLFSFIKKIVVLSISVNFKWSGNVKILVTMYKISRSYKVDKLRV